MNGDDDFAKRIEAWYSAHPSEQRLSPEMCRATKREWIERHPRVRLARAEGEQGAYDALLQELSAQWEHELHGPGSPSQCLCPKLPVC